MVSILLYKEDQSNFNIQELIKILEARFDIKNIRENEGFLLELECGDSNRYYKVMMSSFDAVFISSDLDQGVYVIAKEISDGIHGEIYITNMDFAFNIPIKEIKSYEDFLKRL